MKHRKLLFAALLLLPLALFAQDTTYVKPTRNISIELGGASTFLGINYDQRFKGNDKWGFRVGFGFYYEKEDSEIFNYHSKFSGYTVPLELNYLIGKKKNKLELGLGANIGYYTGKLQANSDLFYDYGTVPSQTIRFEGGDWGYFCFLDIAYRWQPVKGFTMRTGLSPTFNLGGDHRVERTFWCFFWGFGWCF